MINFMYEFVNRFAHSDDESIIASLIPSWAAPAGATVWTQAFREAWQSKSYFGKRSRR